MCNASWGLGAVGALQRVHHLLDLTAPCLRVTTVDGTNKTIGLTLTLTLSQSHSVNHCGALVPLSRSRCVLTVVSTTINHSVE